jgi:hypothetical protein
LKIWYDFPHLWRAITATRFSLKSHSMLTLRDKWANCLGTSTWRVNSPKLTNLWTLPPHCLELRTTWNLGQNLWQDYVCSGHKSKANTSLNFNFIHGHVSFTHTEAFGNHFLHYFPLHASFELIETHCLILKCYKTKVPNFIWEAFLGAFTKLRKTTVSFAVSVCLSVRLSVRVEQLCSRSTGFH